MKQLFWGLTLIFLVACDPHRVFEQNRDMDDAFWYKDSLVRFEFRVDNASVRYNVYANIRNSGAYPYTNLYYQFVLADSAGRELERKLQNVNLFDPKTGQPYGDGLGDLFDHRHLILDKYRFAESGLYRVTFEQYMRTDSLPLILSIGARVERHEEQ